MSENAPTDTTGDDVVLRVKSSSNASALGAAVAHAIYAGKNVSLRAIGAGAVNQTSKSLAIAQGFVGPRGITLSARIGFTTVKMPEGEVTALVFKVLVA
ncbi:MULTISPECIES: stage V sporulation protein S [Streptosporangium]|uniref:Stage V sporulation protein S n=1 Tax=Streptosporangium brasiliense TaxID=47480 RepID=A0ABT9RM90_9ACTN|nr:stage V sporulation protein S [Streptosporangium brasiliense]MDP9870414.1 stage V sporulation protein S [Streptosporangium brasiliense]